MEKQKWQDALPHEIEFWTKWAKGKGKVEGYDWSEDFNFRMNPDAPLQQKIIDLVPAGIIDIKILDVGAGPATVLGKKYPGKNITIVATDPMADAYDRIMFDHEITVPVPTISGDAEKLSKLFSYEEFDVVYCQNALDHSYDPLLAIDNMLAIVNPAGAIMLFHENNEGQNEGYKDLHQWNFCEEHGNFIIWQPDGTRINVNEYFHGFATVTIITEGGHNTVIIKPYIL